MPKTKEGDLDTYLTRFQNFTDKRHKPVFDQMVYGVISSGSLFPLRMSRYIEGGNTSHIYRAKRMYRILTPNKLGDAKLDPEGIMEGVYDSTVIQFQSVQEKVHVSLDFSGLEKAYSQKLEGLSRIHGKDGVTMGYPMLSAIASATGKRGIIYNKVFSYTDDDFKSENAEIDTAIDTVRAKLPNKIRWVADRGLDDVKKFMKFCERDGDEFVVRAHHNRDIVAEGRQRKLMKYARKLPRVGELIAQLVVSGHKRTVTVSLHGGSFTMDQKTFYLLRAQVERHPMEWILITNVDVTDPENAKGVWVSYRQRWGIEDFFKFCKQEFKLEKFQIRSLSGIQTLVAVLMVALSFLHKEFAIDEEHPLIGWIWRQGGYTGKKWEPHGKPTFLDGLKRTIIFIEVEREAEEAGITVEQLKQFLGLSFLDAARKNKNRS